MVNIGNDWDEVLKGEFEKEYYQKMRKFLINEYRTKTVYPKPEEIFTAFKLTSYKDCKIVLLGQDPYHGVNQAHGLAFSVKEGVKQPPSLQNMYKEINAEYGHEITMEKSSERKLGLGTRHALPERRHPQTRLFCRLRCNRRETPSELCGRC